MFTTFLYLYTTKRIQIGTMSFYDTDNLANFSVTSKPPSLKIVYASFTFNGTEFKISPMNLNDYGEFQVTAPGGSSITVRFITNYSNVLGTMTTNYTVTVAKSAQNTISFTLTGLTPGNPYFGTLSLMIE